MKNIKIYLILIMSILVRFASVAQCACTDVTVASNPCPPVATLYTDVNAASSAPQVKTTFTAVPFAVSGTSYVFCTKYTIPAGVTKIGVLNYMGTPNVGTFNRGNWQAFDVSGCSSPIAGTTATSPSGGAAEFTVTPGSTYKFCVTIDISSNFTNGTITSSEFYMYNATTTSTCPASVGTISVTGGTSVSTTEYNLTTNGATISISSSGSVLPSPSTVTAGSTSTYGYFIFTQMPTLPFADVTPAGITSLPGFKGVVSGTSISDDNNSGVSKSVAGATTLYFIPAVFDKKTGGLTLDDDADGCYAVGTPIKVNYSVTPPPSTCSSCAAATCPASSVTATSVTTARTNLTTQLTTDGDQYNTLTVNAGGSTTICVPVTVTAGSTILGFKQRAFGTPNACTSPTEEVITYKLTTSSCGATIAPNRTNASNVSSGFNPEWDNLTPGNYVLCYTVSVSASALCSSYELDGIGYYNVGPTPPPTPPCPTEKTYISLDWKQTNPFISWNAKTYNCSSPSETVYKNVDINTIATGGQIQPFPGFKMDMAMNTNSDTKSSMLVSVNGVPYSYYGPTGTAPAGVLDWGPMATAGQQVMEPYILKGSTVTLSICDTRATNQSFAYTIWDYATGNTLTTGTATPKSGACTTVTFTLTAPTMTWKIDGMSTGVTDNNNGSCSFDPKALAAGNHTLQYTFNNGAGCTVTGNLEPFTTSGGPTITPATPLSVCAGTTSTTFTYTSTGTPTTYSIDWDAAANTAGFSDVVDAVLTASPQSITLPVGAAAATYTGSLTVKNASGCTSVAQNISVTLTSGPVISGKTSVCLGETLQLSGTAPKNATTPWVSASPAVATINNTGLVSSLTVGNTVITYKDLNGCTATKTITVTGNPTLTATPTSILVSANSAISVSGGSGTGATSPNDWVSSSTATATIVGAGQSATVTGVAPGNTNIIYTDNNGCDDTVQVTVTIPGCITINNPSSTQILCQGADPAAFTVSTTEIAVKGINYVVYPAITKPANASGVYSGVGISGVSLSKVTPIAGVAKLDLPALGSAGSLPVVTAGDYYIYAILDPVPSDVNCRPFAEIKVTIKDSVIPVLSVAPIAGDSTVFSWNNNSSTSKWGLEGALTPTNALPTTWLNLGSIPNAAGGAINKHTTPGIPLGQTAHLKITPQDNVGAQLACSNSASASITNPNCTKPIPSPLTAPSAVCEGSAISIVGGLDPLANFQWKISNDGIIWSNVTGPDYDVTTVPSTISIATSKFSMNNKMVKLILTDKLTGACKDSTAPVKLLVNELPNASLSINPDPALLCVGANQLITVTFLGNKGVAPYVFDYTLDGISNTDSSLVGSSVLAYDFNTDNVINDSTFILTKVTDKNGCFRNITINNTVKMQVIPAPKPEFTADQTVGCYPFTVIFTDKSTTLNTNVEWDFGDGSQVVKDLGFTKYTFNKAGDFTISFKSSLNGCSTTNVKTAYIHVKDRPIAKFLPKQTHVSMNDPVIHFVNNSSNNALTYKWIFDDGSPVSNLVNPVHTFIGQGNNDLPESKNYRVTLYAYVNQDCWDSTSTMITIDDEQIYYVPNTFTPNGDEKNNTFQPIFTSGFDAQNFHFAIYDRWGELIFESNNPAIGWDGTYGNKMLMNGTYTWKLQFKEKKTEKEHYLTGHVNLIK